MIGLQNLCHSAVFVFQLASISASRCYVPVKIYPCIHASCSAMGKLVQIASIFPCYTVLSSLKRKIGSTCSTDTAVQLTAESTVELDEAAKAEKDFGKGTSFSLAGMGHTHSHAKQYPKSTTSNASTGKDDLSHGKVKHVKHQKGGQGGQGKDVMISYSHNDIEAMHKIKELLESSGITVWVDETGLTPGTAFLREIGEAIVDSRVFLVILSPESVASKYCQDEVSLAYISNKNIFAVSLKPFEELTPVMDLGMKLTLSGMQWHFIDESSKDISKQLEPLVSTMNNILNALGQQTASEPDTTSEDETEKTNFVMNKQAFKMRRQMSRMLSSELREMEESEGEVVDKEFWGTNFGSEKQADWSKFSEALNTSYSELWKQMMVTEQQKQLLLHLMSKEMSVKKSILTYQEYKRFCTRDKEQLPLSQAIRLYAAETYAMKEVFNVHSSVRLSAITNLGKYQSKAVIDSLIDLLDNDDDPDIVVVAAISLAHAASGIKIFKRRAEDSLMAVLDSNDRLVRESGCLALGRLRSKKAITKLVQLWRNDTISSVREAAQIAIDQVGGDEAEQALHVTKVLSEEIQLLKR